MVRKYKSTDVELVEVLTERNTEGKYNKIIERAKERGYHDFKFDTNPKYKDCIIPKMQLAQDMLEFPELEDVIDDVIDGIYDEMPDEEDKKKLRELFK